MAYEIMSAKSNSFEFVWAFMGPYAVSFAIAESGTDLENLP